MKNYIIFLLQNDHHYSRDPTSTKTQVMSLLVNSQQFDTKLLKIQEDFNKKIIQMQENFDKRTIQIQEYCDKKSILLQLLSIAQSPLRKSVLPYSCYPAFIQDD
jgi:hypothetical protein